MADHENDDFKGSSASRRGFMKRASAGLGVAITANLATALQGRAQTRAEAGLIDKAAELVQANARKGLSRDRSSAVSLAAQYREMGGNSKDVVSVLNYVDESLKQANALDRYNPRLIDEAVSDGIAKYAEANIGAVADKSSQYRVEESAARVMFDRGGAQLKNVLDQREVQVPGLTSPMLKNPDLKITPSR